MLSTRLSSLIFFLRLHYFPHSLPTHIFVYFTILLTKLGGLLLLSMISAADLAPRTFQASFPDSPAPFTIDVDRSFIDEILQKVKMTRLPVDIY